MAYNKTTWVNDETPLNADNMNNIEDGISQNELDILTLEGSKQDKLTSGTNIKTINGESVLGSGNLAVKTYQEFPNTWTTDSTMETLMSDIENDTSAVKGMAYLGEVTCSDLPFQGNAELVIEIMDGTGTSKTIVATLTSGTTSPYFWKYTYWVISGTAHNSGWQSFLPNMTIDNSPTQNSNNLVKSGGVYNSLASKQSITLEGNADPTTTTQGELNQLYRNTISNKVFICTAITSGTPDTYTWTEVGGSNKYLHCISVYAGSYHDQFSFQFVNETSTSYTTMQSVFDAAYAVYGTNPFPATGAGTGGGGNDAFKNVYISTSLVFDNSKNLYYKGYGTVKGNTTTQTININNVSYDLIKTITLGTQYSNKSLCMYQLASSFNNLFKDTVVQL